MYDYAQNFYQRFLMGSRTSDVVGYHGYEPSNRALINVKNSGFKGYIGMEVEGNNQPDEEGIRKTKLLLEKYL